MKKAYVFVVVGWILSVLLSVAWGKQIQMNVEKNYGLEGQIKWAASFDPIAWVEVVEAMEASKNPNVLVSAIVAREGYRIGMAKGAEMAASVFMEDEEDNHDDGE